MDNSHNHGHWFVIGALFSVSMFGALSVMEMNAHRVARDAASGYADSSQDVIPLEPLLIVIPMLMLLVVALAANKWWHER